MRTVKIEKTIVKNIQVLSSINEVEIGDYLAWIDSEGGHSDYCKVVEKGSQSMVVKWLAEPKDNDDDEFTVYKESEIANSSYIRCVKVTEDEVRTEVFI